MTTFVIEYFRPTGEYRITEFSGDDANRAGIRRRLEIEKRHLQNDGWEVVSLNADSLDTIKQTHSRYFFGRQLQDA